MYPGIAGKRVVINGAADGMGKDTAKLFLRNGARVHACDVDPGKLAAFKEEEAQLTGTVADVADVGQVDRLFDEAEDILGGVDILVNNVGIAGPRGPVETLDPEAWARTIDVNLNGHFHCIRRGVPLIRKAGGGSIVNVSSTAGYLGYPGRTPYAASKFAVIGLTKSLSIELGKDWIRVNAICPGPVAGSRMEAGIRREMQLTGDTEGVVRKRVVQRNSDTLSLKQLIEPDDIANMILFICSDVGAKISGQILAVDGDTHTLAGG
jgi:NAD(P)-dependent dehydrogenase (short-subunit alcohol dehydrogenase family)